MCYCPLAIIPLLFGGLTALAGGEALDRLRGPLFAEPCHSNQGASKTRGELEGGTLVIDFDCAGLVGHREQIKNRFHSRDLPPEDANRRHGNRLPTNLQQRELYPMALVDSLGTIREII
ncbi:MAG: hypothetical protein R3F31_22960 [Verrucomicrobiales bacterium]